MTKRKVQFDLPQLDNLVGVQYNVMGRWEELTKDAMGAHWGSSLVHWLMTSITIADDLQNPSLGFNRSGNLPLHYWPTRNLCHYPWNKKS